MNTNPLTRYTTQTRLAGLPVHVSEHATMPPKPARTQDMREMVEALEARGEVHRRPAILQTPQGIVMHPSFKRRIAETMEQQAEKMAHDSLFGRAVL